MFEREKMVAGGHKIYQILMFRSQLILFSFEVEFEVKFKVPFVQDYFMSFVQLNPYLC